MEKELITQNSFRVVGELVENNLEIKTSKTTGKDFISGRIVVKSVINGRVQLTEIEFYSARFKADGSSNKLFETYSNMNSYLNKRIRVSGEISENRFYSTQNNQVVSTTVNKGRFVSAAETKDVDVAEFTFGGYIVKNLTERLNKSNELIGYEMILAQTNYNDTKPVYIKFSVDKTNTSAVNAIQRLYDVGMTVSVRGDISVINEDVEVEEQTAFGESTRVYHNTYRNYVITTGSQPMLDRGVYAPTDISRLTKAYNDEALEIERDAKGRSDSGQTQTAPAAKQPAKSPRPALL